MDLELVSIKGTLIFFRVLSVLWLVPLLSSKSISILFKGSLALIITNSLFYSIDYEPGIKDVNTLPSLIFREILLGLSVGFVLRIIFSAFSAAGEIIGIQTGLGFARFMDPQNMTQASVIEGFKNILAVMVFFATDAHHLVIKALGRSFADVPLGGFVLRPENYAFFGELAGRVFTLGLKIGGPLLVVLLIVEVILGVLSRVVPQVNIFLEGIPLKILVAIVVLSLWVSFGIPYLGSLFLGAEADIKRVLEII